MHPKGSIVPGGDKDRALKLLAAYPAGLHLKQIAKSLGMEPQRAADVVWRLGKAGLLQSLPDPDVSALRRRRYCTLEHLPTCTEAVRRAAAGREKAAGRWPRSSLGRVDQPPKEAPKAETVCVPCPPDLRFTVVEPEPFFSDPSYRTSMLRSGSVIEAAYGGGND